MFLFLKSQIEQEKHIKTLIVDNSQYNKNTGEISKIVSFFGGGKATIYLYNQYR